MKTIGLSPCVMVVRWLPSGGTGVFNCLSHWERALLAMLTTPLSAPSWIVNSRPMRVSLLSAAWIFPFPHLPVFCQSHIRGTLIEH